jgi:hypothetical protein
MPQTPEFHSGPHCVAPPDEDGAPLVQRCACTAMTAASDLRASTTDGQPGKAISFDRTPAVWPNHATQRPVRPGLAHPTRPF